MTSESMIDYEALAQDAMRSVVRAVLTRTASTGLPGDHHFYISFDTQAEGTSISKRLKEKYSSEMTIVLQHRFWELKVYEDRFEVKLSFDGIPERLVVPFSAIKVFFDPSVRYGLQFEDPEFNSEAVEQSMTTLESGGEFAGVDTSPETRKTARRSNGTRKPRGQRKTQKSDEQPTEKSLDASTVKPKNLDDNVEDEVSAQNSDETSEQSAQIVRLDAFRKNNRNSP